MAASAESHVFVHPCSECAKGPSDVAKDVPLIFDLDEAKEFYICRLCGVKYDVGQFARDVVRPEYWDKDRRHRAGLFAKK